MNKIYFISDLDKTIIHSKNKGFKCVEKIGDREITYMTDYSYDAFKHILSTDVLEFIPCTMRNLNQIMRVDFIREYSPQIIISTNGAQIYINGSIDLEWESMMRIIGDINEVNMDIEYIESLNLGYEEIRNTENFYVTMKFFSEEKAEEGSQILRERFSNHKKIFRVGIKVFVIHEKINKANAVDYIIKKFGLKNIITSGDSVVDEDFTRHGVSLLPKHSSFRHDKSVITKKRGIFSTDELMDKLKEYMEQLNA